MNTIKTEGVGMFIKKSKMIDMERISKIDWSFLFDIGIGLMFIGFGLLSIGLGIYGIIQAFK